MRELRFANAWRWVGFVLLALALAAMLAPGGGTLMPFGSSDKLAHAAGFFALTLWFAGVYRRDRHARIGFLMLLFGVLSEVLQGALTRARTADPADFLADAVGVALALIAARIGVDHWTVQVERLLAGP